jgi:hypothetical protein
MTPTLDNLVTNAMVEAAYSAWNHCNVNDSRAAIRAALSAALPMLAESVREYTESDIQRLRGALNQIVGVCSDNASASCRHGMALDFVAQIARAAIRSGK